MGPRRGHSLAPLESQLLSAFPTSVVHGRYLRARPSTRMRMSIKAQTTAQDPETAIAAVLTSVNAHMPRSDHTESEDELGVEILIEAESPCSEPLNNVRVTPPAPQPYHQTLSWCVSYLLPSSPAPQHE